MAEIPRFASLREAYIYCRDMDASLADRLNAFSEATRYLLPGYQEAVDRMAERLGEHKAARGSPSVGDEMPPFAMPDERGAVVTLEKLIDTGPVALTFHRGLWCPYCRISTRALAEVQDVISARGGRIAAIVPEREQFAAAFKEEGGARYPVLTDIDNGYALSLGLAIWLGAELDEIMSRVQIKLEEYQGANSWLLPIPATFVIGQDGRVKARFVDPDYRRRMAIEDLLVALESAIS